MRLWSRIILAALLLPLLLEVRSTESQEYAVSEIGDVQVQVGQVNITGKELRVSIGGSVQRPLFRFLSVPYAQPPTGQLRFAPPVPLITNESASVNATYGARSCPRVGAPATETSEDCLYLSIRTPDISAKLPVLVLLSSGAIDASHGDAFAATQNVVLVTVASRQGVLGFLSLNSPLNIGLQDQRAALKLIKNTVGSFGGDSTRITLGGHGSAAAAAGLHAVSNGSSGLFQRLIMLSGSIASPLDWSESEDHLKQLSANFAERLNCTIGIGTLECLRKNTTEQLLEAESEMAANFVPVGAGEFFNFSDTPDRLWRRAAFAGPLLIGAAEDAGWTLADEALGNRSWESVTRSDFANISDIQFRYYPRLYNESSNSGRTFLRLINSDWPDSKFGSAVRPLLSQAIGDYRVICPVWEAASDFVRTGSGQVFVFLADTKEHKFFLGEPLVKPGHTEAQRNLSQIMMEHLASFVSSSAPSSSWSPMSLSGSEFMYFRVQGNASAAGTEVGGFGLVPGRCPLWKHELPFLSSFMSSASEMEPRNSDTAADTSVRVIQEDSSFADTILSNFSVNVLGFAKVIGQTIRTDMSGAGVIMSEFLGIPYAQPPVGHLRFAKPVKPPAQETIVALRMPPLCMQRQGQSPPLHMSEDCLYLNIWTPMHSGLTVKDLPVIVYLHGGFFQYGGISDDRWRGSRMLDHVAAIVVTVNYRLGAFGFLSLDTGTVPGNFGLWDQEMALDWVSRYIIRFGGSRTKITLMGVESGAVSIGYHMARPIPLFQRAVMLTGSPFMSYPVSDDTVSVRLLSQVFVQSKLNCLTDTLACLRNLTETEINEKQAEFQTLFPGIEFRPVIDVTDFIQSDPMTMDPSGLAKIPLMFGFVDSPGNLLVQRMGLPGNFTHQQFLNMLNEAVFYFPRFPKQLSGAGKEAVRLHFKDYNEQNNSARDTRTLATLIGTLQFTRANNKFLDQVSSHRSVYSFRFAETTTNDAVLSGANLFDDTYYAFGNPASRTKPHGDARAQLSKQLLLSIVSFADTGTPNWTIPWPTFSKENRMTLVMRADSQELTTEVFMAQECGYWDHVLPCVIDGGCLQPETTPGTTMTATPTESTVSEGNTEPATGSPMTPGTDKPATTDHEQLITTSTEPLTTTAEINGTSPTQPMTSTTPKPEGPNLVLVIALPIVALILVAAACAGFIYWWRWHRGREAQTLRTRAVAKTSPINPAYEGSCDL